MDSMHDRFRVLSFVLGGLVTSGASPEAVFTIGDNCVEMAQERMAYYTRCLQELPRITVNDVNHI